MPPLKKATKKAPAKSASKHEGGTDLRRAHEHRGRVEALRPLLGKKRRDIDFLVSLAERELAGAHGKDAADLLRATEHLSFGFLASSAPDEHSHPALSESVNEEFHHKLKKAEEHWEETERLAAIYQEALDGAHKAFHDGAHHKALEFIRAAEAIAHVHLHGGGEATSQSLLD